ncbi:MAG: hypothetical protein FJ026_14310 [Chloroflexi bacterium]|nr:hypothetical protein [Chloroflexota bacterium]
MSSKRRQSGANLFVILSLLVVLSMILGTLLTVLPDPERRVEPTAMPVQPTATRTTVMPTPTPTLLAAPSPLPQPTS